MPAINSKKLIKTAVGSPVAAALIHTVTAAKTLAANLVLQNKSAVALAVTLYITGTAAATETLYAPGAVKSSTAYTSIPGNVALMTGSANTSRVLSADYRTYSVNGGLTWSTAESGVYYGITSDSMRYSYKLVVTGPSEVKIYPSTATGTFTGFQTNPITVSYTGIADLVAKYPQAFLENVLVQGGNASAYAVVMWPTSETTITRYYSSSAWNNDVARTMTVSSALTVLSPLHYATSLDTNGYYYHQVTVVDESYTTHWSSANYSSSLNAQAYGGTSLAAGERIVMQRTSRNGTYTFYVSSGNKCWYTQKSYPYNGVPASSGAAVLPGSISVSDIKVAFGVDRWVIEAGNGTLYRSTSETNMAWTTITAPAVTWVDCTDGLTYGYVSTAITIDTLLPGFGSTFFNATWTTPAQTLVRNGVGYAVSFSAASCLSLEQYTLGAGETLELTGRLFDASTAVRVAAHDASATGQALTVALYGMES